MPHVEITELVTTPTEVVATVVLDVPVSKAWRLWTDRALLELWWGRPTHGVMVGADIQAGSNTKLMLHPEPGWRAEEKRLFEWRVTEHRNEEMRCFEQW